MIMKALFLAAGVGTRIIDDIGQKPKSLLKVNDRPILQHTIDLMKKNDVEPIVITGFKHRMIEDALVDRHVRTYYNPFYRVTNSIGSLWCAREELVADDVIIANADVYYTQDLLDVVMACPHENYMLCDSSRVETGDYFFYSENGILVKYGKELGLQERNSEYVGTVGLRGQWIHKFRDRLCAMIEAGEYNLWWEDVLYSFVGEEQIHTVDVNGVFWSEVDTIMDYQRVLDYCEGKEI